VTRKMLGNVIKRSERYETFSIKSLLQKGLRNDS
jgi:hypothetical protein